MKSKVKIPKSLNNDKDWAQLIEWLRQNNMFAIIPLKGSPALAKKAGANVVEVE